MNAEELFRYSMRTEQHLSAMVRSGDPEGVDRTLTEILRENLSGKPLAPGQETGLLWALNATAVRLLGELESMERCGMLLEQLKAALADGFRPAALEALLALFQKLALEFQRESHAGMCAIITEIQNYVEENFYDQELNLNSTAERFGLSVSHLSQAFRRTTGVNFSAYLETLRVERACEYLARGLSVKQTSERVGYNSVYVFRKAFVRRKSILPSDYSASRQKKQIGRSSDESTDETYDWQAEKTL